MGDPDLFINFGRDANGVPRWPSVEDADWASQNWNNEYDIKSIYNAQPGEYYLGVQAFTDTSFSVMGVRSGTIQQMSNGVVYPGQLMSDTYQYYQFVVSNAEAPFTSKTLLFSLSTLSATQDPDLFCSDHIMYPNHTTPGVNQSTSAPPYDMIRFSGQEGQLHNGTYYCGVRAWPTGEETSYVFSAYLSDRKALEDGVPTYDSVMGGEVKYYTFTQQNGPNASDVIVSTQVNEGQGVAWLYINFASNGDPDIDAPWPAEWVSNVGLNWRHQQITLWSTYCRDSPTPCSYAIAVFSPLSSGMASYTIVAASGNAHQWLEPGVIYYESISTQTQARYYQFDVVDPRTNITVVVDSFPNDVDLYISRSQYYPSTSSPEGWQYGNSTGERAFITPADRNYGIGPWWVTVYGYHPTPYTIRVTFDIPGEPSVLRLVDAQPVRDYATTGQWRYYEYTPPQNGWPYAVNFALTAISGDPDLFVRVSDGNYPTNNFVSSPVTATTWFRSSTMGSTDIDQLSIGANVAGNCNPNATANATYAGCSYTIGVYAFNTAEWYLVVSTSKSLLEVRNGVTVGPTTLPANQWNYYFFREIYQPGLTLSFSLVTLRGNPDLFVSSLTAYPNATNSQWRSTAASHDMIFIPNANVTIYYVAVHASFQGGPNEYTLTARLYNASNPTAQLFPIPTEGIAYSDSLPADQYRYWSFNLNSEEPTEYVTFTVKALVGDPDIYINYALEPIVYPTAASSQWSKFDEGDDIVTITSPQNGRYIIGIHAFIDSFYTITVTTAGSLQVVSAGQMYSGVLLAGQSNYYRYPLLGLQQNTVLSFAVTLEYGNPDLFVSDVMARPNRTSYVWSSTSNGADVVTISNTSAIHTGNWYATVYAVTDVSYYFYVSYGGVNQLTDCYSYSFSLAANTQQRYTLSVAGSLNGDTTDTQISLTMSSGYTGVYVGVGTYPQLGQANTYFLSVSQTQAADNPNVMLNVPRQRCFNTTDCVINILLVNYNPNGNRAAGSILVASGRCAVSLQAGVSVAGTVSFAGEFGAQYYRFRVPSNYANVTVRLTMTNNGNADLFCAVNYNKPGYTATDWSSLSEGTEDLVYFDWTDPLLTGIRMAERYFYCAVMRPEGSPYLISTYSLLYTYSDASGQNYNMITLEEGMPLQFNLPRDTYMYFRYTPSPIGYPYDVFIQLTALDGNGDNDPDVYVRNDGELPTQNYNFWESTQDSNQPGQNTELLVIPGPPTGRACNVASVLLGECTYYIGVLAYGYPAVFQIMVDTSNPNTYTRLTSGNSVQGVVAPMSWHYYSFEVTSAWNTTTLTSLSLQSISGGNPDLYVAAAFRPNSTYFNQSSTLPGSDVVQWMAPRGRYIAGVYNSNATASANYYITEFIGPIPLMNGQAVEDTLLPGQQRRYMIAYSSQDRNTLTIDVTGSTPFVGLTIYVRVGGEWSQLTPTNYMYTANPYYQTAGTITILPTDPYYSTDATYHILVVATQRSQFTITAADGTVPTTLVNGIGLFVGAVPMGDYRYFRGVATAAQNDLVISVTLWSPSSVTMYVSQTDRNPSSLGYNFTASTASYNGFGGQRAISVVIPRAEIKAGYYYVSVRTDGPTPASYNVQLTTSSLSLFSGVSQEGQCSSASRFYSLNVARLGQDVNFLISPSNWQSAAYTGRFQVYVSRSSQYPTATNNQWSSGQQLTINKEWTISKDDTQLRACITEGYRFGGGCTLYIATQCQPPTANVSYLFTATVGKAVVPLVEGLKREVSLAHGQSDYYVSYVQNARVLWLMAEPCRGSVRLDVSNWNPEPSPATPGEWVSTRANNYQSVIVSNGSAFTGIYYSGVRAMEADTVYRMVQSTSSNVTTPNSVINLMNPRIINSADLQLGRDDTTVYVTFSRATLPAIWKNDGNWRYTLRYALYLATQDSPWLMYTECGLNHTMQVARVSDLELDEAGESVTLSFEAGWMNSSSMDPADSFKINVLAQVWQQPARGSSIAARPIYWTAYSPVSRQRLEDLPYTGPGGNGMGPGDKSSVVSGPHGGAVHPAAHRLLHRAHRRPLPVQAPLAGAAHSAGHLQRHQRAGGGAVLPEAQGHRRHQQRRVHQRTRQQRHQRHQWDQWHQRAQPLVRRGRLREREERGRAGHGGGGRHRLRSQPHAGQQLLHTVSVW